MVYDTTLIHNRIVERFGTCKAFADSTSISPSTLSRKLKNGRWNSSEMDTIIQNLGISNDEINLYFFVERVPKKEL